MYRGDKLAVSLFSHLLHRICQRPNARGYSLLKPCIVLGRPLELFIDMHDNPIHPVCLFLEASACAALYVFQLLLDRSKLSVRLLLVTSIEQSNILVNLLIELHIELSALVL